MTARDWLLSSVIIIALLAVIGFQRIEIKRANDRIEAAEQRARLNAKAAEIADEYSQRSNTITEQTEKGASRVQDLPGAEAPLPDDLRSHLCDVITGMRGKAEKLDGCNPSEFPRAVPRP